MTRLQTLIEFALAVEANEDRMAENAAMQVTCDLYGIDLIEGYDWLLSLPDGPWWLQDSRLSPAEKERGRKEYEAKLKEAS